jgi:hypothetical protein
MVQHDEDALDSKEDIEVKLDGLIKAMKIRENARIQKAFNREGNTTDDIALLKGGHADVFYRQDNLLEVIMSMLIVSSMMYRFAAMCRIANLYDIADAPKLGVWDRMKGLVPKKRNPSDITDTYKIGDRFEDRHMRLRKGQRIKPDEVYNFLKENAEVMKKEAVIGDDELKNATTIELPMGDRKYLEKSGAEIVGFDNSMDNELVYSLIVNR